MLKTLPAFKTQPVGRYIAAVSFGVTGAFYGARSAARACLERIVRLEDSRLGELAADAVRRSAPLDPMLAKAPNATGGDAAGGLGAGVTRRADSATSRADSGRAAAATGEKGGGAATSTRAAIIRAAAEAEASRRVRARERRPSPPVVDLSEEPRASASASRVGIHVGYRANVGARRRPATALSFSTSRATRSPRRGCTAATRGPLSDTCRTRRAPGEAAAAAARARGRGRGRGSGG